MKIQLLAGLMAAVCLGGCALSPSGPREVADQEMTVFLPGGESAGLFTGTLEKTEEGGTTARGAWESLDGWRYEGLLTDGLLTGGTAELLPCSVTLGESTLFGMYTGPVAEGLPLGEGTFAAPDGVTYSGAFDAGTPTAGTVAALPLSVDWGGAVYSGLFSGDFVRGAPEGRGSFTGENPARATLSWEGGWAAGLPAGEGRLSADRLATSVEGELLTGGYTGQGMDGVPAGEGGFAAVTGQGIPLSYEGEWSGGLMNGQGELRYESENYYVRAGTFTAGTYTPTWMEALRALGTCQPLFTLTPAQEEFIAQYPALWEEPDHQRFLESEYQAVYDRGLTLQSCLDAPQDFQDQPRWMCLYSLRTIRADNVTLGEGGMEMTCITAADGDYARAVRVIVPESLPPIVRGTRFHIYAVPLAVSSYTTVWGMEQPCLVMLAGDIYLGQ